MSASRPLFCLVPMLAVACAPGPAGGLDGGAAGDAAAVDGAARDSDQAGDGATDAGASCPAPFGLGILHCDCDQLDDEEWSSSAPYWFDSALDFGTVGWDEAALTPGGQTILAAGNLNEGSLKSEITSYEALARCEGAIFLKGEDQIGYDDVDGKKTDLLVEIDGRKVGVSVTRAFHYPPGEPYTAAEAGELLLDKLADIPLSAANALPDDAWERSLLGVVAYDAQHAETLERAWNSLDDLVRADIILYLTVTDGDDAELY